MGDREAGAEASPSEALSARGPGAGTRRATIVAWVVLAAATTLPYAAAERRPPPGQRFTGAFLYQDDFYQYLSFVEQAMRGSVLFVNKFDLHPHRPVLLNVEWWTAGVFARLLGGRVAAGFHVLRVLALAALMWAVIRLLSSAGLDGRRRAWATALFATGGGLGWLRTQQGRGFSKVPDLYMGLYPFHQALNNTHFVVGTALLLCSVTLYLEWQEGRVSRWAWVATGCALGLSRPYDLATFLLFAAGVIAPDLARADRRRASRQLLELLWLVPVLVYDGLILGLHPSFRLWSGPQALILLPPRAEFLWALAPPALLALLALRSRQASQGPVLRCLAIWCLALAVLSTLRTNFGPQFSTGVGTALLLMAGIATPARWLPMATLLLSPTSLLLLWRAFHPWPIAFAPADEIRAASFLGASCRPPDLAFAPIETSLRIAALTPCRVAGGHRVLTPDYASRVAEALTFYDPATDPAWRRRHLAGMRARYVLIPAGAAGWLRAAPYEPVLRLGILEVWRALPEAGVAGLVSSDDACPVPSSCSDFASWSSPG